MTTWLTDRPSTTSAFLPDAIDWHPATSVDSTPRDEMLMRWFNPGRPHWRARSTVDPPENDDGRVHILMDHSEASQFDTALNALKQSVKLPDGLTCIALTGSRFRGQRQRPWTALRGNLHFTAHYTLGLPAREIQAALTMIPAIISAGAMVAVSNGRIKPEIKWVNDVLVEGRKVSGVLTATHVSGDRVDCVVFGIGMNIKLEPEIIPTPFVPAAGCLAASEPGLANSLPAVYHAVIRLLDQSVADLRAGQTAAIFEAYRGYAAFIGKDVRIWPEGTEDWRGTPPMCVGKVAALNPDLSLVMAESGRIIRSGRMAIGAQDFI